ncbi:MAG TPA: 2-C-methyl-D-erythritol 2,4-cyclodiphosphate synthase [Gemmatimonadaceae bacterium]|nr:2-C-methyl-D-erythritol 2,4-cyclodiphosphate synthase [Gemmatimonadaceae bacterium]
MPRKAPPRGTSPPLTGEAAPRVGIGYDSHPFALGRPLTLGGILIPSEIGLAGHSDADAICHALTDAILGAAGLGDIGEMFPDNDPANKDRDSIGMLEAAVRRLTTAGFRVNQVDVTVIAETPRLSPHRDKMRSRLAVALGIDSSSVSVKGKTNEGMGWIGRKEGLACIAVATLTRNR